MALRGIQEYIARDANNIARVLYPPKKSPCHKAGGIHDFILATKSPIRIIIKLISMSNVKRKTHVLQEIAPTRVPFQR